jgi:hypothetical protein
MLQGGAGLYYEDTEQPLAVEALQGEVQSKWVQALFGKTPYILPYHKGFVVTNDNRFQTTLPDQPGEKLVHIGTPAKIMTVDLDQRYRDCNHIVKIALGCSDCPDKGTVCVSRGVGINVNGNPHIHTQDEVAASAKIYSKDSAFEFVSPQMTRMLDFQPVFRHPEEHDFSKMGEWAATLSARATKGAVNRKFKKEQCSKCPLEYSCDQYRSCKGRYPSEADMTKAALALWMPRVKDKTKNPFKPWQFWALARINNIEIVWNPHKRGHRPRKTNLCGLEWNSTEGWYVRAEYTRWASLAFKSIDYNWLCALFPTLPKTKADAEKRNLAKPPVSQKSLALWLAMFGTTHGTHRNHGFGGGRTHDINGRILSPTPKVCFAWSDRYASPGYSREIPSWRYFWSEISHTLPLPNTRVR